MNIFDEIKQKLTVAIGEIATNEGVVLEAKKLENFAVSPARDEKHGDLASNVAMVFAKDFRDKPANLAAKIIAKLSGDKDFTKIEIAGAGFINFVCQKSVWHNSLAKILD